MHSSDLQTVMCLLRQVRAGWLTVVHWKKVLPQKFWVVPIVGVGPRLDL